MRDTGLDRDAAGGLLAFLVGYLAGMIGWAYVTAHSRDVVGASQGHGESLSGVWMYAVFTALPALGSHALAFQWGCFERYDAHR